MNGRGIAARLRLLRDQLGYSQDGMGAAAGLPQRTWSRWEKDVPEALVHLAQLAQRTGTSAEWLLGLTDDPTPPRRVAAAQQGAEEAWPEWAGELVRLLRPMSVRGRAQLMAMARALAEEDRQWLLWDELMDALGPREAQRIGEGLERAVALGPAAVDAFLRRLAAEADAFERRAGGDPAGAPLKRVEE